MHNSYLKKHQIQMIHVQIENELSRKSTSVSLNSYSVDLFFFAPAVAFSSEQ